MEVNFKVVGVNSLFSRSAKFRRAVEKAPEAVGAYAEEVGALVKELAIKNSPELTGNLKASYKLTVAGTGTHWNVNLRNEAEYFDLVLSGHKAFIVRPVNKYALPVGGPDGDMLRMFAHIPAQPPNPILQKTMSEARPLIRVMLAEFKAKMFAIGG